MRHIDWTRLLTWLILPLLTAVFYGSIIFAVFRSCCDRNNPLPAVRSDTVIVRDTIRDTVPRLVKSEVVRYVKETPIPLHDTVYMSKNEENVYLTDSGEVIVPISRRVYTDDSTYRAVVSGYKATLEQIDVYRRQTVITNTVAPQARLSRWSVGIVGGYGYGLGSRAFEPFVGLGVAYRLYPP